MADGFIETGHELMFALKQGGIVDSDREAGEAAEDGVKAIIAEVNSAQASVEKKLRRMYFAGVFGGLHMAKIFSELTLKQKRFEEGKDPETGQPMKEPTVES